MALEVAVIITTIICCLCCYLECCIHASTIIQVKEVQTDNLSPDLLEFRSTLW